MLPPSEVNHIRQSMTHKVQSIEFYRLLLSANCSSHNEREVETENVGLGYIHRLLIGF